MWTGTGLTIAELAARRAELAAVRAELAATVMACRAVMRTKDQETKGSEDQKIRRAFWCRARSKVGVWLRAVMRTAEQATRRPAGAMLLKAPGPPHRTPI